MTPTRLLVAALVLLTALLLQTAVVARLPLPGTPADLLLVVVAAFGVGQGPAGGLVTGFLAGLLVDVTADGSLGRFALAYAVAGYLAGLFQDDSGRSALGSFAGVAVAAVAGVLVYAGEGLLVGDPRVGVLSAGRALISSVPYDVLLTPLVVPAVGRLVRRVDTDLSRR